MEIGIIACFLAFALCYCLTSFELRATDKTTEMLVKGLEIVMEADPGTLVLLNEKYINVQKYYLLKAHKGLMVLTAREG